jgi:hypothetical protein
MNSDENEYFANGMRHRANGPAISYGKGLNGGNYCNWYLFGNEHRYYGPQNQRNFWWIHGKCVKW